MEVENKLRALLMFDGVLRDCRWQVAVNELVFLEPKIP
jgi:hypothetical protein